MKMEEVKKSGEYKIFKKRSGRYAVKTAAGKWLNGEEKTSLLLKEKLIKITAPKKKVEPPKEEAAPEAPAEKPAAE